MLQRRTTQRRAGRASARGFSYAEILLSVVLLAVLLVPALQSLNSAILGSGNNLAARQLNLRNKMEEVLSQPFGALYADTYKPGGNSVSAFSATFSDGAGVPNRRAVVLYRYDAATNALSANDTGLLYVSVYYKDDDQKTALNTLVGRWW